MGRVRSALPLLGMLALLFSGTSVSAESAITFGEPVVITEDMTTRDILEQSDNFEDGVLTVGGEAFVFDAYGHPVLKGVDQWWWCRWLGIFCSEPTPGPVTVTLDQAKEIVLARVIPDIQEEMRSDAGRDLPLLAFARPDPLARGTIVPHFFGRNPPLNVLRDSWFFFLDLEPFNAFGHRTEFVLVDTATGEISRRRAFSPPVFDGEPWLLADLDRQTSPDRFYPEDLADLSAPGPWPLNFNASALPLPRDQVPPREGSAFIVAPDADIASLEELLVPSALAQTAGGTACPEPRRKVAIVINGEPRARDQHFEQSAGAAMAMFRTLGVASGDMHYFNPMTHPTPEEVVREIERIGQTLGPCDKLFFYITGHGTLVDENGDDIPDTPSESIVYGGGELSKGKYGNSFTEALAKGKAGIVNIIIQSCFAGSTPDVIDQQAVRPLPGTMWHIFPSSDAVTSSYGNDDDFRSSPYTEDLAYCIALALAERGIQNPTIEQIEEITRKCHEEMVANPEDRLAPAPAQDVRPETITVSPDVSIIEGDEGVKYAEFTITRTPADRSVQVEWKSYDPDPENPDLSGFASGRDYEWRINGQEEFAPGETSKTIRIPVYGDTFDEQDETFGVWFPYLPSGQSIRRVTIVDDDPKPGLAPQTAPQTAPEPEPIALPPVTVDPGGIGGLTSTISIGGKGDYSVGWTGGDTVVTDGIQITITVEETCDPCEDLRRQVEDQAWECAEKELDAALADAKLREAEREEQDAKRDKEKAEKALKDFRNPRSSAESGGRRIDSSDLEISRAWSRGLWDAYRSGDMTAEELEQQWKEGLSDEERQKLKEERETELEDEVDAAEAKADDASAERKEAEDNAEEAEADAQTCDEELQELLDALEECEKLCVVVEEETGTTGDDTQTGDDGEDDEDEEEERGGEDEEEGGDEEENDDEEEEEDDKEESDDSEGTACVSPLLPLEFCEQACDGECIETNDGCARCQRSQRSSEAQQCPSPYSPLAECQKTCPRACERVSGNAVACYRCPLASASCPSGELTESLCERECDGECAPATKLADGKQCFTCEIEERVPDEAQCPQGHVKEASSCPSEATAVPDDAGCFSCVVITCPQGTTKNECPSSCGAGCEVAAQEGSVTCYRCKQSCEAVCAQQGYARVGIDWSSELQAELLEYSCVSGATAAIPRMTIGSCVCSNRPTLSVDRTVPVCAGTTCGDVPCGSSVTCPSGENATTTVSCTWGGWRKTDVNVFQPVIGE